MKLLPPFLSRLLGRRQAVRGPGKTTPLATILDDIDQHHDGDRILSIEDTPELMVKAAATPTPPTPPLKPRRRMNGGAWLRRWINPALRGAAAPPCLLARLENGVEVIYTLDADGLARRAPEVPDGCPIVLSATVEDLRLVLPEAMPHAAAKSRLIRETASYDKLGVVSAGLAVYGTPFARIAEARAHGQRLAPLSALADRLAMRQHVALPSVTGVVFGEEADGTMAIAIFFAQLADGKTKTYLSVNPDNLQAIYAAFLASIGLPEDTEPVVFTQAEALAGLSGFYAAYPTQDDVLGFPAHLVWRGALASSAVLCLVASGWWWSETETLDALKADAALARVQQAQHVDAIGLAIAGNLPAFNRLMGLAPRAGLADAESLYLPSSRVESVFSAQASQHDVFVPLRLRASDVADDPDAHALTAAFALSRQNCQRTALEYSGALDEIRIRFSCPGGNAAATPFRG